MQVRLIVTAGPHAGKVFAFDRHDTFLVGRSKDAHLQLSYDDPYFSRRHFLVEVNPPRVRLTDLGSRNGTHVNGQQVDAAELKDRDEVRAGHTIFRVHVPPPDPDAQGTLDLPGPVRPASAWFPTVDRSATRSNHLQVLDYERAFLTGQRPRIEAFLPVGGARPILLLRELVLSDIELRAKAGEPVKAAEYFARFPELNVPEFADEVRTAAARFGADRISPTGATGSGTPSIPGYAVGAELGRGGMGVVYRAVRQADGRQVALKTVLPAAGVSERQLEKFVREARVVAGLDHPNVVAHLDSGTAGGLVYLAMELVEGPDADRVLRAKGPLAIKTAVRAACGMLAGLAHAHAKGIVHRDVKPSNLLLGGPTGKRVVKVADFGLARAYDECQLSGLTMQGEVGGTPAFMAPEQVTHFRDVRPAADQYSAAATLYTMLAGKPPHDLPKDVGRQLGIVVNGIPVPVRDRRAEVPAGLAAVLHKALAREPAERYPDVSAFRTALLPYTK
jgi:hypothetical protein